VVPPRKSILYGTVLYCTVPRMCSSSSSRGLACCRDRARSLVPRGRQRGATPSKDVTLYGGTTVLQVLYFPTVWFRSWGFWGERRSWIAWAGSASQAQRVANNPRSLPRATRLSCWKGRLADILEASQLPRYGLGWMMDELMMGVPLS
jgi:hypothetical protein